MFAANWHRTNSFVTLPSSFAPAVLLFEGTILLESIRIFYLNGANFSPARPVDYPEVLLLHNKPISSQKFSRIDSFEVYEQWLGGGRIQRSVEAHEYNEGKHKYCIRNQSEVQTDSSEN